MIRFENVTKQFDNGVKALDNLSLNIPEGSIYGIIGMSGAGKSTLIRCINGLEVPTSGRVIVDGKDMTQLDKEEMRRMRMEIGMIFQSFNLFESKTIFENVAYPLNLRKVPKKEQEKAVQEMLEFVDIEEKDQAYPTQLSGGQQQRVAIARALVSHPKILLLDEATSALDPVTSDRILELIKDLKEKLNLTVVLITHDMDVVKKICTDVAVLKDGQIQKEGKIGDVFRSTGLKQVFTSKDLPKDILTGVPLSLFFDSKTAREPIISQLIRALDIDVNILLGKIEYVGQEAFGSLLIEVRPEVEEEVRAFLEKKGVEVEDLI